MKFIRDASRLRWLGPEQVHNRDQKLTVAANAMAERDVPGSCRRRWLSLAPQAIGGDLDATAPRVAPLVDCGSRAGRPAEDAGGHPRLPMLSAAKQRNRPGSQSRRPAPACPRSPPQRRLICPVGTKNGSGVPVASGNACSLVLCSLSFDFATAPAWRLGWRLRGTRLKSINSGMNVSGAEPSAARPAAIWTCPGFVSVKCSCQAALCSKSTGDFQLNPECLRRGL